MTDTAQDLALLQHGDSFFPSGAVSFSWGLETLVEDGRVHSVDSFSGFLVNQLRYRWATSDRAALAAAYGAGADLEAVIAIDRLVEAQTLALELREGSRRTGRAQRRWARVSPGRSGRTCRRGHPRSGCRSRASSGPPSPSPAPRAPLMSNPFPPGKARAWRCAASGH